MVWKRPIPDEEQAELVRTAQDLGLPVESLMEAMTYGSLVDLDGYTWCSLENTDCNETFSLAEVEDVARRYGKDVAPLCRRITSNQSVPAPIILVRPNDRPWLVSGNVRLMLCRGLNVQPKVWRIAV